MTDLVMIFLRAEMGLREVAWSLLEQGLVLQADLVTCHELFLKAGAKRKLSSNQPGVVLVAEREKLEAVMDEITFANATPSAFAVPVLQAVGV